jgi:hypothetical protein
METLDLETKRVTDQKRSTERRGSTTTRIHYITPADPFKNMPSKYVKRQ